MHYKGVDKPLAEIARELNVDAVVEGTVYQTGENVRIGVTLIDVLPEEQNLWADTYDRPMTDVLIMYSEMARAIADKTQVNLSAEEMTRLTSASQVNPESYDACLKGKPHLDKLNPAGLKIALQYFELALEIDPNNALAHLGIARVWGRRYQMGMSPRHEAFPLIEAALEKALELDNTLAEAHAVLAGHRCWREWDWESAEKEFQQTFRLNPNHSGDLASYSHFLCHMGRTEEALPHIGRALELDALNPMFHAFYGVVLVYNRRFDDALAAARAALDMVPNHPVGHTAMSLALTGKGMSDELLTFHREGLAKNPELAAAFERGLEEGGYEGALRATAELQEEWYGKPGKKVTAWNISLNYLKAGDYDMAIDWLEKAYEDHSPNLPYIGWSIFDPLHSDPRFQDLLRKMNLPPMK
jgi:tetratricopeptide (TPR) repeat protein